MSKKSEYISHKIEKLSDEGYKPAQAAAIAYSYARKRGFDIPKGLIEREKRKKK